MIVVDASVLANAICDDAADGRRARAELRSAGDLAAPDLVDVETVAVLRKRWLAGTITDERFKTATGDLARIDIDRYPTAYDASYVALAEALNCDLLTADERLASATGPRCAIQMLR